METENSMHCTIIRSCTFNPESISSFRIKVHEAPVFPKVFSWLVDIRTMGHRMNLETIPNKEIQTMQGECSVVSELATELFFARDVVQGIQCS